jgi:hypothetical protein
MHMMLFLIRNYVFGGVYSHFGKLIFLGTLLTLLINGGNRRQWIISGLTSLLCGAAYGGYLFHAARVSHSSTGGPILAMLSPLLGLWAAFVLFPLVWGSSGFALGIRSGAARRVLTVNAVICVLSTGYVTSLVIFNVQAAKVSSRDPAHVDPRSEDSISRKSLHAHRGAY